MHSKTLQWRSWTWSLTKLRGPSAWFTTVPIMFRYLVLATAPGFKFMVPDSISNIHMLGSWLDQRSSSTWSFMYLMYLVVHNPDGVQLLGFERSWIMFCFIFNSVDVQQHWAMLQHWSQFVPNMSTDIRGQEALHHHHHHYHAWLFSRMLYQLSYLGPCVCRWRLAPNSKHWFTTSFLQPLPYLVTP